ncbi:MAG: DUF2071 domain-containing protein [Planctomycetia bacterium]|nr:DUF2071 domain-containing protein [Planctomycetia bacterium]
MNIPVIYGLIERRVLLNYRVEPDVLAELLPAPFRPQLVGGKGIAGICLIRLSHLRPKGWPAWLGVASENAAHRIAVEWFDDNDSGKLRRGVYIPRRDTSSAINTLVGGRLFPGVHHRARFDVEDELDGAANHISIAATSRDNSMRLAVTALATSDMPRDSVFGAPEEASAFFQCHGLGYSATANTNVCDGLELQCYEWRMEPLAVERAESSYFADETLFPPGSIEFDSAWLMRNIVHEWHAAGTLCCGEVASSFPASAAILAEPLPGQ